MIRRRVLVVDDDESLRRVTQVQLEQAGYDTKVAADGAEAMALLQRSPHDLVISDLKMPEMSGLDLLRRIRSEYPDTVVVMITAFGTVGTAVEAMKAGAYDYITKPVHADELDLVVRRSLEHLDLLEENRILRSSLDGKYGFDDIIGHSKSLLHVLDMAARAARTDATVLIRGKQEPGRSCSPRRYTSTALAGRSCL